MARVPKFKRYPNTFQRQSPTFYGGSANTLPERRDILYVDLAGYSFGSLTVSITVDNKLITHDELPILIPGALINDTPQDVNIIEIDGNTITFECVQFETAGFYKLWIPPFFPAVRSQLGGYLQGGTWGLNLA